MKITRRTALVGAAGAMIGGLPVAVDYVALGYSVAFSVEKSAAGGYTVGKAEWVAPPDARSLNMAYASVRNREKATQAS